MHVELFTREDLSGRDGWGTVVTVPDVVSAVRIACDRAEANGQFLEVKGENLGYIVSTPEGVVARRSPIE